MEGLNSKNKNFKGGGSSYEKIKNIKTKFGQIRTIKYLVELTQFFS